MGLPTRGDLQTMDYHWFGAPVTDGEPTPLQTSSMDYHWFGAPVVVVPPFQPAIVRNANSLLGAGVVR